MQPEQTNKRLIIVFTLNDEGTKDIFNHLPRPEGFVKEAEFLDTNYPLVLIEEGKKILAINPEADDEIFLSTETVIVLVKDDLQIQANSSQKLKTLIAQCNSIYVVYHTESTQGTDHKEFIQENCMDKNVATIDQHHTIGSVFDALKKIAESCKQNRKEIFVKGEKEILDSFPDPLLEAKLDLMHHCLTPKGIPQNIPSILKNEFERKLIEFKTIVVGITDPFDKNYIKSLDELRNSLLTK